MDNLINVNGQSNNNNNNGNDIIDKNDDADVKNRRQAQRMKFPSIEEDSSVSFSSHDSRMSEPRSSIRRRRNDDDGVYEVTNLDDRKKIEKTWIMPQFYRGNHGEVSPIRVRPVYMTRYPMLQRHDGGGPWNIRSQEEGFEEDGDETIDDDDDDDDDDNNLKNEMFSDDPRKRGSKSVNDTDKSLYSHVMHRVKTFSGGTTNRKNDDHQRLSSFLNPHLPPPFPRPAAEEQRLTEEQLAMWLEKIRRRKAYRSLFSALVPGGGGGGGNGGVSGREEKALSTPSSTVVEDDDYDEDANDEELLDETTTTTKTPSRVLFFPDDDPSTPPSTWWNYDNDYNDRFVDPFKSPASGVKGVCLAARNSASV